MRVKSAIKTFFLIWLCLIWHADAVAKEKMHLSLREAILLALRYNQAVQGAELQRIIDKFTVAVAEYEFEFHYAITGSAGSGQAMSDAQPWTRNRNFSLTPVITRKNRFGTQFGVTFTNPLSFSTGQSGYLFNPSATLAISHPLLRGSGTLINEAPLMQAYNSEAINKLNYKNTVIGTVTAIILDYRAVVQNENALLVDKAALKSAQQTVEQNKIRIEHGFMAPSENIEAEYAVATQALQVTTDTNSIIQSKLTLLQDMGLSSLTEIEVDKSMDTDHVTYPEGEEAKTILFQNNITYLSALINMQNTKLGVLQAEDSQRWQLDFTAQFGQGPGSGGGDNAGFKSIANGRNVTRSIGLNLAIPIDDMSAQQGIVSAKVGYDQQKLQLKQLRLLLESQLVGTLQNLSIAKQQIVLAKRAQELANMSYENSLRKLTYGKVSLFEVTTLQTNLVSAQIAYIGSEINFLNLVTTYQQTLGTTLDVWNIQLKY